MAFLKTVQDHLACFEKLKGLGEHIEQIGQILADCIRNSGKILICGNGGSAADAQHFAAELIGRFEQERDAWPAIALTTDTSILTAIGNDYGFDDVFARQVQGLGCEGDCLIGISTSGNSENVLRAVHTAGKQNMRCVALLGRSGGRIHTETDMAVVIPWENTARIQEAHIFILHYWAMCIEQKLGAAS